MNHLANMGKYISAMVAAGARITYARQENHLWFTIVLITSVIATVYQLCWDFVKDWGFLNPKSKNPWLRDDLILKKKGIYYFSIVRHTLSPSISVGHHWHCRCKLPLLTQVFNEKNLHNRSHLIVNSVALRRQ